MAIVDNPKISEEIKKKKKLLETYELFTYGFKYHNKIFYYVRFTRFGKETGKLVICEEPNPSNEEIIKACKSIFNFNRVINVARDQLYPDMKKPVDVLEDLRSMISDVMNIKNLMNKELQSELMVIEGVLAEVTQFPDKLSDILSEMKSIEKTVLDRGYVLTEDVVRMMDLNISHNQIMYGQGRKQLSIMDNIKNVKKELNGNLPELSKDEKEKVDMLVKYLKLYTEERITKDLKNSQDSFEIDGNGNPLHFQEGPEGLEELSKSIRDEVDQLLQKEVEQDLRNFN